MFFMKFVTEDSWTTASDFQQHFGHIASSISNKSTKSQQADCLSTTSTKSSSQAIHIVYLDNIWNNQGRRKHFLWLRLT